MLSLCAYSKQLEEEEQEDKFDLTVGVSDPEKVGELIPCPAAQRSPVTQARLGNRTEGSCRLQLLSCLCKRKLDHGVTSPRLLPLSRRNEATKSRMPRLQMSEAEAGSGKPGTSKAGSREWDFWEGET